MRSEKKVSEMNFNEKFQSFRQGVQELTELHFNGENHKLPPIVFLGVKAELLKILVDMDPNSVQVLDKEADDKVRNKGEVSQDKIHIIPIEIAKFMEVGGILGEILGTQMVENIAKDLAVKQVKEAISFFESKLLNSVQFCAHVCEAYVVEEKKNQKEISEQILNGKTSKIEEQIKSGTPIRDINGAKEKVIILFESRYSSTITEWEMLRNEDTNYQELINIQERRETNTPAQGLFGGLLHKQDSTN